MRIVFSTHPLLAEAAAQLSPAASLRVGSALNAATIAREAADAEVVIVRAPIPEALVTESPRLRAFVRFGAGVDMIPVDAATRRGVLVANVPGVNAGSVAQHVLMVTLMLLRRHRAVDNLVRAGAWADARTLSEGGGELTGRQIGLIGFGAVGQAVARVFTALGANVGAYSPSGRAPAAMRQSLDQIFAASDVVVLCCALTETTRGMVDRARFASMKPEALLVNVSRGAVIDDAALIAALREGRIAGAALDVFTTQPLPLDHVYHNLPNVVVTPHVAGLTRDSMRAMSLGAVGEVNRVLDGDVPVNLVNPEALALYRQRLTEPAQV